MICPNCGCECDDNAMFCRKCGTKINSFHSDITQTSIDKIDNTEEDIFAGIKIESGREVIVKTKIRRVVINTEVR